MKEGVLYDDDAIIMMIITLKLGYIVVLAISYDEVFKRKVKQEINLLLLTT